MNGTKEIADMMKSYRDNPPKEIAGSKVTELYDYGLQQKTDLKTGTKERIALPKSDVLQFITEDGSKISARPSGTEPKIKFYFSVHTPLKSAAAYEETDKVLSGRIQKIIADLKLK